MAAGASSGERTKPIRRSARPHLVGHEAAAGGRTVTGSVPVAARPSGSLTAYTPEWFAREHAADERLRRQMNICRGC